VFAKVPSMLNAMFLKTAYTLMALRAPKNTLLIHHVSLHIQAPFCRCWHRSKNT